MQALVQTLRALGSERYTVVLGMLADKDTEACCRLLAPFADTVICCEVPNARTLSAEKLAEQMRQAGAKTVLIERKPRRAVALAAKRFGQTPTVITGSLYLCADIRDRLPRLYKI
jgi:dihydrofolate synthase/folylpolyglutamate synthase